MSKEITYPSLPGSAETIRKEIKSMIPGASEEVKSGKAERLPIEIKGGVAFGGDDLAMKVSKLISEMKIGKWIWTVAQFHEAKEILNDTFQMYLIPITDNLTLSLKTEKGEIIPQPALDEGFYTHVKINPIIGAGGTVIFITPPE